MTERSYERAVQVLKDRVGMRWEGVEADGRDEMARALEHELGVSHGDADALIDDMIDSGELTYHRATVGDDPVADVIPAVPAAGVGGVSSGGVGGVPVVPAIVSNGYWQIGSGESERGAERIARQGQVDPTQ